VTDAVLRTENINSSNFDGSSASAALKSPIVLFLEKYCVALCLLLVAIASARIISTYNALSLTGDEPFHFGCAIDYLSNHTAAMDAENPPVARALQAVWVYADGARPAGKTTGWSEGPAILMRSGNFDRTVFLLRLGTLSFFLLACWVVGTWANRDFGRAVAVIAVGLFTLLPTSLADAGLATTDMALAATTAAAFLATIVWARKPTPGRATFMGFFTALALLTKLTAPGYLCFSILFSALAYWSTSRISWRELLHMARSRFPTFAIAAAVTMLLIWAAYWFSFGPVTGFPIKMPAPGYFEGLQAALNHDSRGHGAFLLGQYNTTGWWYYFPIALAVKTPIAFLILVAAGIAVCIKRRAQISYLLPITFSLGILLPAMAGRIDIGIRHIAPIFLSLSIIAALGVLQLLKTDRFRRPAIATALALIVWMSVSVGLRHPDYLSYFNAFAGKHPENVLDDSNYDWGQDLKFLAKRLRELGARHVTLGSLDGALHNEYREAWYGLPPISNPNDIAPSPGWTVISASFDKSYRLQLVRYYALPTPWYHQVAPTERLGPYSLYYTPLPGEVTQPNNQH
jgi:hypothetical protein